MSAAGSSSQRPSPGAESFQRIVGNCCPIVPPAKKSLVDNTLLFLPERAVRELCIEPNMDDKGDDTKTLWFGRVWELRALVEFPHMQRIKEAKKTEAPLTPEEKRELDAQVADPRTHALLTKLGARWKGMAIRKAHSFHVLDRLKFSPLRGTLIYLHGSGGCSWDNMRMCRMACGMGMLVVAPDGYAYPPDSQMGKLRCKTLQSLHLAEHDVDYWANDLIYDSDARGTFTYSTKAEEVLRKPGEYRDLYEKCYQLRRSELHYTIVRLPLHIKAQGFYLGGCSEGAMTVARFDDQRYGHMLCGRFIVSFSVEYCYFTPRPEDGQIGGQLDVPTLNIIGSKDQFFGPTDSVAKIVVEDRVAGYGNRDLDGNGYKQLVRQNAAVGLVCVLEDGVHSPCDTHDNFLRHIFLVFFVRPSSIADIDYIWKIDPSLDCLISVRRRHKVTTSHVTEVWVPRMMHPQQLTLKQAHALASGELTRLMLRQDNKMKAQREEISSMLTSVRSESSLRGFRELAAVQEQHRSVEATSTVAMGIGGVASAGRHIVESGISALSFTNLTDPGTLAFNRTISGGSTLSGPTIPGTPIMRRSVTGGSTRSAPRQEDGWLELTFDALEYERLDHTAFKHELMGGFRTLGASEATLTRLRVTLRPGSVIAEVRGPASAASELGTFPLSSLSVMGCGARLTSSSSAPSEPTPQVPTAQLLAPPSPSPSHHSGCSRPQAQLLAPPSPSPSHHSGCSRPQVGQPTEEEHRRALQEARDQAVARAGKAEEIAAQVRERCEVPAASPSNSSNRSGLGAEPFIVAEPFLTPETREDTENINKRSMLVSPAAGRDQFLEPEPFLRQLTEEAPARSLPRGSANKFLTCESVEGLTFVPRSNSLRNWSLPNQERQAFLAPERNAR